jgi:preprotein translocase subunit SecG
MWQIVLATLLAIMALFMILLILIQRGRGGGLVGALGGMGGQSAFGTKAGDLFTRITMWTAFFWIVIAAGTVKYLSTEGAGGFNIDAGKARPNLQEAAPGETTSTPDAGATTSDESKE